MSQNQSYFWHTTRRNVYLKRAAKLQMFLALIAVLTFSTVCLAETEKYNNDGVAATMGVPTLISAEVKQNGKDDVLDGIKESQNDDDAKETKSKSSFLDAFSASISVILVTELGDKTFFIAAILAMQHPRIIVFSGALLALALMTVLSVVFGMAATIIPKVYTYYISTALFAIFGLKMLYEGYFMKPTDAQDEYEGVRSEIMRKGSTANKKDTNGADSEGSTDDATSSKATIRPSIKNSEMHHRQRKQRSTNKTSSSSKNKNCNGCEISKDTEYEDECTESDVFLDGGAEHLKMSTFHSSPVLSSSVLSNQTMQTNCDEFINSPKKHNFKTSNGDISDIKKNHKLSGNRCIDESAMVHSASTSAVNNITSINNNNNNNNRNSINSLSSLSMNSAVAAGQGNGELKELGGSKIRLERDIESGTSNRQKKSATYLMTKVLMQAFTMTFLAEWGDRSQLTTIILAASKNVYGVIVGGILGHSLCTGLAVIGGRIVATKISVRTVTILGGIVFLGFALYALIVRPDDI